MVTNTCGLAAWVLGLCLLASPVGASTACPQDASSKQCKRWLKRASSLIKKDQHQEAATLIEQGLARCPRYRAEFLRMQALTSVALGRWSQAGAACEQLSDKEKRGEIAELCREVVEVIDGTIVRVTMRDEKPADIRIAAGAERIECKHSVTCELKVAPGDVEVRAVREAFEPHQARIEAVAGEVTLHPVPLRPQMARLTLVVIPEAASVELDGKRLLSQQTRVMTDAGHADGREARVYSLQRQVGGTHLLSVDHPGYVQHAETIRLVDQTSSVYVVRLQPHQVTLSVSSSRVAKWTLFAGCGAASVASLILAKWWDRAAVAASPDVEAAQRALRKGNWYATSASMAGLCSLAALFINQQPGTRMMTERGLAMTAATVALGIGVTRGLSFSKSAQDRYNNGEYKQFDTHQQVAHLSYMVAATAGLLALGLLATIPRKHKNKLTVAPVIGTDQVGLSLTFRR